MTAKKKSKKAEAIEDLEQTLDNAEKEIAEAEAAEEEAIEEQSEADAAQAEADAEAAEAAEAVEAAVAAAKAVEEAESKSVRFCGNPGYSLVRGEEEITFPFETDDQELIKKIISGRGFRANEVWVDNRTSAEAAAEEAALSKLSRDKLARLVHALGYRNLHQYSKSELIDILSKGGFGG
jgi:3-oxoacyl-ACP reductase-like protein